MHDTAKLTGEAFLRLYGNPLGPGRRILDVGSRDVNGTLRPFAGADAEYIGADVEAGPGVDFVLEDPYRLPFADASFDLVIATSCLEHDPLFWLTFDEMARVARLGGFLYVSVPVQGPVHRHPVDCWRFYPDAGSALVAWAARCGHPLRLTESFQLPPRAEPWVDFVAVFERCRTIPQRRIVELFPEAQERLSGPMALQETAPRLSGNERIRVPIRPEVAIPRTKPSSSQGRACKILGAVERMGRWQVYGWVRATDYRVLIEVFIDGKLLGSTWAQLPDLNSPVADGETEYKFLVEFQRALRDDEEDRIEVCATAVFGEGAPIKTILRRETVADLQCERVEDPLSEDPAITLAAAQ